MKHFGYIIQTTLAHKQDKTSNIVILSCDLKINQRYVNKSLKLCIFLFSAEFQFAIILKLLCLQEQV